MDQAALWLGLLRERRVIGDPAAFRLLRRELPTVLAVFRSEFGDDLACMLEMALNHGPLAIDAAPIYKVLRRDEDKVVLSACR